MSKIKDIAAHNAFEAVYVGAIKSKDGFIVKLAIHPNEVPEYLIRDFVGTRYQVALVALNDQNEAVEPQDMIDGERAVQSAGMLCREKKFWEFLERDYFEDVDTEARCVEVLHELLKIKSRTELLTNKAARTNFADMKRLFERSR